MLSVPELGAVLNVTVKIVEVIADILAVLSWLCEKVTTVGLTSSPCAISKAL
jgi:hypothetical protein